MEKIKNNSLPIINIIMLTFVLLLSNIIVKFNFDIFGYAILANVISYPFIYFFANRITQKSNIKITIFAIITAIVAQTIVYLITYFLTEANLNIYECTASLISFTISIFLNLLLYKTFILKKEINFFKSFLIYTTVLILDSFIFLLIISKGIPNETSMIFLISTGIKILISLFLSFFETCWK